MTGDVARAVVEGYTAPRASVRRLLDGGHGIEAALGLLALAYLVQAMLTILFLPAGIGIFGHMLAIMQQLVTFFLLSALVYGIGRLAGGAGTMEGAQLVIAWHALVTSLLSPLAIGVSTAAFRSGEEGAGNIPPGMGFLALIYVAISLWLMANYVAELHGFRSTWGVLGAIIGVSIVFALMLAVIVGAMAPA
jgi:hypothetical protein